MTAEVTGLAPAKSVAFAVRGWACHHSGQPCAGLQPLGRARAQHGQAGGDSSPRRA